MRLIFAVVIFSIKVATGQVVVDTSFHHAVQAPKYQTGGPKVQIDKAHNNYHSAFGRYLPFTKVLKSDGYVVGESDMPITEAQLQKADILVIANALHRSNFGGNWRLPTPSAFTETEIDNLVRWIERGGRLFLIADHMPFAGAAKDLAKRLGFNFCNCFALDNRQRNLELFKRNNRGVLPTDLDGKRPMDSIITFTGSAFQIEKGIIPILALKNYTLLSPDRAWEFTDTTPFTTSEGYYQLAYRKFGKGKVVVSGEAGMFTAQLADGQPVGMNHPNASQNIRLLLSLMDWLTRDE